MDTLTPTFNDEEFRRNEILCLARALTKKILYKRDLVTAIAGLTEPFREEPDLPEWLRKIADGCEAYVLYSEEEINKLME